MGACECACLLPVIKLPSEDLACKKKKKKKPACTHTCLHPAAPSRRMAELPGWQQVKLRFRQVCGLRRSHGGVQPRPAGACGRSGPMPANASRTQSRPKATEGVFVVLLFCDPTGIISAFSFWNTNLQTAMGACLKSCAKFLWR